MDTTHPSQGQTADRVLIHVDTELGAKDLLNNRMAYVAVSRGAGARCIAQQRPCAGDEARTEAGAGHHAAAEDSAAAGEELGYWLGSLVKRLGIGTTLLAYGFSVS
jgi:hypothetical protein